MRSLSAVPMLLIAAALPGGAVAVEAGKPAPPLSLTRILQASPGATAAWDTLRGRAVVLEFWATWCAPCVAGIPHWNKLVEPFQNRPVRFLSVTDEAPELIEGFLKDKPMFGWVGLDGQGKTFDAFVVEARPITVLVDADGVVRAIGHPQELTEAILEDFLAGKPVSIAADPGSGTQALPQSLFEISIRPAAPISVTHTSPGGRARYGSGAITYGVTLANLLSQIHGVPASRVSGPDWVGKDAYDVAMVLPAGTKETDALQMAIGMAFHVQSHKETRDVPVYELRRTSGADLKATPATAQRTHVEGQPGDRQIYALPLSWIVNLAPKDLGRPIFDETGIQGNYDYSLKWDPSDPQSFLAAVREGAGLELVPSHRPLEFLVVDSAVRPAAR